MVFCCFSDVSMFVSGLLVDCSVFGVLLFYLLASVSSSHFRSHLHILMQANSDFAHLHCLHFAVMHVQVVMNFSRSTEEKADSQRGMYPLIASYVHPHSVGSGSDKSDRLSCHR